MFSFRTKSKDLRQVAAAAETAAKAGRTTEAEMLLRQIVQFEPELESSPAPEADKQVYRKILGQAFLDLGEICEKRSASAEALAQYGKARYLGAALTPAAWAMLAESYANQQAATGYALGAYFAYIQQFPPDEKSAKVYAALEAACRVDEHSVSEGRKRAAEINKRVIAINGELEWPYYYLAVAYLQDGDLPAAMMNLLRARKRNPNRAMTYYWMGACHLRQSAGSLDVAIGWFSKFLAFAPENPQISELQASAAFELGKRLLGQERAIPFLELAAARDGSNAEHHFLLGKAYSLGGDRGRAISALERAVSLDPSLGDARELLIQACLAAARYETAEAHARTAINLQGRQPASLGYWLRALYGQEKLVETVTEWERGPAFEAGEDALFCVARAYSRLGRFAAALEMLERLPRAPRSVYYSGCALANLGRIDEARARFQEIAADPGEYAGQALVQLGNICLRADDIAGAGDSYDRALAQDPADPGALYAMGSLAYRMGEIEVAAECFSKVLASQPGHIRARFAMGAVHESRGEAREAIACYEEVRKPLEVRVRLGVCYCRNGQYEEAERILESLHGSTLESDAVLYYLGMAAAALDRRDEALDLWNQLAARHPRDPGLESGLAELYLGQALQQWESREAEALLDQALIVDPRNARCRYYRALYDWKRGKLAEAADRLRELSSEPGAGARALYHLGLCLSLQGKRDEAAPFFDRAAQDHSNDYGRYAAWTLANHYVGQGQYAQAEAILAGIV